jgi:predicted permease
VERELNEEVCAYLELLIEGKIKDGLTPQEARRAALIEMGGVEQIKEGVREVKMGNYLQTLWQDLRYGIRVLSNSPGFTIVAVLTLALGIGANTAIFSVVNAVLLRSLPYPEPERLVRLYWQFEKDEIEAVTSLEFEFWKDHSTSFEAVAGISPTNSGFNLAGGAEPQRVRGLQVSEGFFKVLDVSPILGRAFLPEEDRPGGSPVVIIGDGLWRSYFGGDPDLIGKQAHLNGRSYTIVGILPPGFQSETPVDVLLPLQLQPTANNDGENTEMIARLKAGVTREQAQVESEQVFSSFRHEFPNHAKPNDRGMGIRSYQESIVGDVVKVLWLLLGAVGFVLLIACANIANLLLARGTARKGEIAIRLALGASRGRVIRQLLTESCLLALIGGVLGLLIAHWCVPALLAITPKDLPRLGEVKLDYGATLFAIGASLLTGLLFGIVPALRITRLDLSSAIKASGRTGTGRSDSRVRGLLIVSEVALSLVLLIGAGLMIKSLIRLYEVGLGFDPNNLTATQISLTSEKYKTTAPVWAFEQQVLDRISGLPGVVAAATSSNVPMERGLRSGAAIRGRASERSFQIRAISPKYFAALGIPVISGRVFDDSVSGSSVPVAVINETLAHSYWPEGDLLGDEISIFGKKRQVVGVVGDIREIGLDQPVEPTIYLPMAQMPDGLTVMMNRWFVTAWLIRTDRSLDLSKAIRDAVREADPQMPVASIRPMSGIINASTASRRFILVLMGIFASLALVLTAVGIYGVLSYQVTQRTHELGIRMALGAKQWNVVKLIVGEGMALTLVGVAVGLAAAYAMMRLLSSLLYEVSATDPLIFAGISLLLTGVALVACLVPARRATRVDPMIALRYE